jgi:hypothetical protein
MAIPYLPPVDIHGVIQSEPKEIFDCRSRKVNNGVVVEILVRWSGQNQDEASWEDYHRLKLAYPHLVGKVL